jgi:hypothetical protein
MKEYIDKLKEIETLVELSIGTTMTEDKATDIYAVTNDLMCKVKKLNKPAVRNHVCHTCKGTGLVYIDDGIKNTLCPDC